MALATFTITNDGQFLIVTSSTGSEESINLDSIKDVSCVSVVAPPGTYPYTDMNLVTVEINGREADLSFDLAAVTNQAGWTLDQAGCVQAQTDIRGWLNAVTAPSAGGATEATLVSVLNAIVASDQDIEILLVRDTGNGDVVLQQITDYTTGTPTVTYKDVNGNVVVPVGPIEYLDPSAVMNLILSAIQAQGLVPQATEATLQFILDAVGYDGTAHGLTPGGMRAMGSDGTLDQQLLTDTAGRLQVDVITGGGTVGAATEVTLAALNAKIGALGQQASAASSSVVLSTEQEAILATIDAVLDTIKLDTGAMVVDLAAIEVLLTTIDTVLDAIKLDTANLVPVARTLTSLSSNIAGSVAAGQRAVTFYLDGPGGSINAVVRPNGWSQTFEFDNDTTPQIDYVGTAACTIYIDYLT